MIAGGASVLQLTDYIVVEVALYQAYQNGVMCDELCAILRNAGFELIWAFNVYPASADFFFGRTKR